MGFHASRILCLDLDSSRTGALGKEVDVVEVHTLYISRETDLLPYTDDIGLGVIRNDEGASLLVEGPDRLVVYLAYNREREFTQGKNRLKILVGYALLGFSELSIGEPGTQNSDFFSEKISYPLSGKISRCFG